MKTKTTHTPGPWRRTSYNRKDSEVFIVGPEGEARPPICACHSDNANLIAGAPDLLLAAKKLLFFWQGNVDQEFMDLKYAVAKAEGK